MTQQQIKKRIQSLSKEELGVDLWEGDSLKESGMDSLSLVALIVALEEDFSIEFSDDDLCPEKIEKFEDLVVLVEKYI